MPLKIAMIGAGAVGWTRRLMRDLLAVPEFADTTFALTDISEQNLEMVAQLCERDIAPTSCRQKSSRRPTAARPSPTPTTSSAPSARAGSRRSRPTWTSRCKYGVDQCVGDTLCAGGIMYAQRGIAALLDFCKDIREVAKPGALLLNYANPMAMMTWAANKYGGVKTSACATASRARTGRSPAASKQWAKSEGLIEPDEKLHRRDVDVVAAGINHQTWFIKAQWRGMDLIRPPAETDSAVDPSIRKTEKVRIDVLRRFGYYSTESNGHLSEYLPWYRKRPAEINQWIDLSAWINGETGGYLRVCTEGRNWFETDFPNWLQERAAEDPRRTTAARSTAPTSSRRWRRAGCTAGHFNVPNRGYITNLPDGCVVEVPGYVDRTGINMPVVGDLPLACAATCAASVRVQEMGVEAAVQGDVTAAQAGHAARPAGRRRLQPRGGLADGRRDAGRPGQVAAAVQGRDPPGRKSAWPTTSGTAPACN